jgi:hypothetical protein
MFIMARAHSPMIKATARVHDLQRIKGIGPVTARHLQAAGISSCAQLARLSPGEVVAVAPELSAERIKQEAWFKQARALTSKHGSRKRRKDKLNRGRRQHYATFTVELLLNQNNTVRRTEVVYVQGQAAQQWAGWEEQGLIGFFRQQAGLKESTPKRGFIPESGAPPERDPASGVVPASSPTSLGTVAESLPRTEPRLSGCLRVGELLAIPIGSCVPRVIMHPGQSFCVIVVLDLSEVLNLANVPIDYAVVLWAKKLGNKSREIVGQVQGSALRQDKISCNVEVSLTVPGAYRLEAIAIVTGPLSGSQSHRSSLTALQSSSVLQIC